VTAGILNALVAEDLPGPGTVFMSQELKYADGLFDVVIEYAERLPSPQCEIFFGAIGGATKRPAPDATAYPHRDAEFVMNVHGRWTDAADDERFLTGQDAPALGLRLSKRVRLIAGPRQSGPGRFASSRTARQTIR